MVSVDPPVAVRAFIGMIIHHSLNNNLWDPKRRLLNISNESAAKQFTDILLYGISTTHPAKQPKKNGGQSLNANRSARKK
jgi:hypothetical protein